jgi:preprotein translocase subunit YajC
VFLKVGDSVRTAEGLKGKIVVLTKDGISAYVLIIGEANGARAVLYRLDALTKIGEAD